MSVFEQHLETGGQNKAEEASSGKREKMFPDQTNVQMKRKL